MGYRCLKGMRAARELARLYAVTRLFVNALQPSFKLMEKAGTAPGYASATIRR